MTPMWNESDWEVIVTRGDAIEFDWYAQDRLGYVAAFSSFGRGAIPQAATLCRDSYNALYYIISTLPESTEGILVYDRYGRFEDWLKYSRQGLFGYDYQDAHRKTPLGQYDLLTIPRTPLPIERMKLPPTLLRIVPRVDVEFGREPLLPFHLLPQ